MLYIPNISQAQTCDINVYKEELMLNASNLHNEEDRFYNLKTITTRDVDGLILEVLALYEQYEEETECVQYEPFREDVLEYLDRYLTLLYTKRVSLEAQLNMDNFISAFIDRYSEQVIIVNSYYDAK